MPVKNRTVIPFNCFRSYVCRMSDHKGSDSLSEMCSWGVIAMNSPELMGIPSVSDDSQLLERHNLNFVASAQFCICFSKVRSVLSLKTRLGQNFPLSTNLLRILNTCPAWHFYWRR